MIAKLIPTRVHGVLDYLSGLLFLILPRLLDWGGTATTLLTILGVGTIIYSLITRYELGIVKVIPMTVHLVIDLLAGLFLIMAPFLFPLEGENVTTWFIVLGVLELGAALLTDTTSSNEVATDDVRTYNAGR